MAVGTTGVAVDRTGPPWPAGTVCVCVCVCVCMREREREGMEGGREGGRKGGRERVIPDQGFI